MAGTRTNAHCHAEMSKDPRTSWRLSKGGIKGTLDVGVCSTSSSPREVSERCLVSGIVEGEPPWSDSRLWMWVISSMLDIQWHNSKSRGLVEEESEGPSRRSKKPWLESRCDTRTSYGCGQGRKRVLATASERMIGRGHRYTSVPRLIKLALRP